MSNFISSPQFLGWVILVTFLWVVFKVLQKNVRWRPRGITGTATVARLQSGLTGLLPKSTLGRASLIGIVMTLLILWMFGALPAPTKWKGSWETPSLRIFTDFAWDHWLPIVLFWGIVCAITAIAVRANEISEGAGSALYRVYGWIMVIIFIILPSVLWVADLGKPSAPKATTEQVLILSPNGESVHLPSAPGHHFEFTGAGFTAFVVYRDGSVCSEKCPNGPILEVFVRDTTGKKNSVSYELVRS